MSEFNSEYLDHFLSIVRKYMQLRGPYSQKELADLVNIGVSTISRFLNKKTTELNPQLIAVIVAKLDIPLSEFIDFVDEIYEVRFKRLVRFHQNDGAPPVSGETEDLARKIKKLGDRNEERRKDNRRINETDDGITKPFRKTEIGDGRSEKKEAFPESENRGQNKEVLKGKFKVLSESILK